MLRKALHKSVDIVAKSWSPTHTPLLLANDITLSKQPDRENDTNIYIRLIGTHDNLVKFYIDYFGTQFTDPVEVEKTLMKIRDFENHIAPFESHGTPFSETPVYLDIDDVSDLASKVVVKIRSSGNPLNSIEADNPIDALRAFSAWCEVHEAMYSILTISAKCTNFHANVLHWKFDGSQIVTQTIN